MNRTRVMAWLCGTIAGALLAGCGGHGSSGASISGSVTGLATGPLPLILADNATDSLTISANGNFVFTGKIASQGTYNVTVKQQPSGQTCVVSNGSGVIDFSASSVGNVTVNCTNDVAIGVSVSGLNGGNSVGLHLILQNDPTDSAMNFDLTATADGNDQFATLLPIGYVYSVSVSNQPAGQVCKAVVPPPTGDSSPTGGVVDSKPIVVAIDCAPVQ